MKARGYVFGVILVFFFGGYSAYWYLHANQIEKTVKAEIANLDEHVTISYDTIEKRGFPFSIQLAFVNPKVHVENAAITFDLDGTLAARWSLFGDLHDIDMSGKSHFAAPLNDDGTISDVYVEGNTVAEFDSIKSIGDKGLLKLTKARVYSSEKEGFGALDCMFDHVMLAYDIKNPTPDRSLLDIDVAFTGGTTKVSEPGETIVPMDFYKAFASTIAEKSGKQDASFALTCDLPSVRKLRELSDSPLLLLTETFPKVSIELKTFDSSNALSASNMQAAFNIHEDEQKNIVMRISGEWFIQFFAAYHQALVASIDKMAAIAPKWDAPQDLLYVKKVLMENPDSLKVLVPHVERLGKIEASEGAFVVVNKRSLNWHATLETLGFSCDRFSLLGNAVAQERNNSFQVDGGIRIKNGPTFIDDLLHFYNRIEQAINLLEQDTTKHLKPLPASAKEKIMAYLELLASDQSTSENDLHIAITYNEGVVHVGPLTLEEARGASEALWCDIMGETVPVPSSSELEEPVHQ